MEYTVSTEQIDKLIADEPSTKEALKKLFPGYFSDVAVSPGVLWGEKPRIILIERRVQGKYKGIGYYLNPDFDWEIFKDAEGVTVLQPKKKLDEH